MPAVETALVHADAPAAGWVGRTWRRLPRDVLAFVGYQLALAAAIFLVAARRGLGLTELSFVFRNYDANWFLSIAHHGYRPSGDRPAAIAFFPLYPATIRVAMWIFQKDVVAAFAVSVIASVAGHTLFYRALRSRPELTAGANNALVLLAAFPTAIFFSMLYSESLYLLLTGGFLYFLFRDRIGIAAVLAALAALTRQPGFLCVVPLGLWVLTDTTRAWPDRFRRVGWTGVAATGYATFLAVNKVVYHDWFAFAAQLKSHWGKHPAPLWETIPDGVRFLRDPDWYLGWPIVADHYFVFGSMLVLAAWPLACRARFERCRWVLLAWGGAQWVMIVSSSTVASPVSAWMSSTRYLMLVLPLYVALTDLARDRRSIVYTLAGCGGVLLVASLRRWITRQWIA